MTNELEERLVAIEMALANQEKITEDLNPVSYTHLTLPTICSV